MLFSPVNDIKVKVNVEFYDKKPELITASSGTARFIILAQGDNSSFSISSDLGEEIITSNYRVIHGGEQVCKYSTRIIILLLPLPSLCHLSSILTHSNPTVRCYVSNSLSLRRGCDSFLESYVTNQQGDTANTFGPMAGYF